LEKADGLRGISWRGKAELIFIEGWMNKKRSVELLKGTRLDILGLFPKEFHLLQCTKPQ